MNGEVLNPGNVARRIARELSEKYPDAQVDFYVDPQGLNKPHLRRGPIAQILPVFVKLCESVPRAWMQYEPDHPYGLVIKLVAHCGCPSESCSRMCQRYRERPKAFLTLTKVGSEEVLVGGYTPVNGDAATQA